jgi:hypothetical protein
LTTSKADKKCKHDPQIYSAGSLLFITFNLFAVGKRKNNKMSSASSDDFPSSVPDASSVQNVLLVSIDGWGLSKKQDGNAILNAQTPNMDKLANDVSHIIYA